MSDVKEEWLQYQREKRAASDPWDKRALEYHKASVEFSKMIMTNLYLLNAGGLVGLPALTAFLGIKDLPNGERTTLLWSSAGGFGIGILCTALCSLSTYYNYQSHQMLSENSGASSAYNVGIVFGQQGKVEAERKAQLAAFAEQQSQYESNIVWSYKLGHIFGWLALVSFIVTAIRLGVNLR